jgi:hypothetical protein
MLWLSFCLLLQPTLIHHWCLLPVPCCCCMQCAPAHQGQISFLSVLGLQAAVTPPLVVPVLQPAHGPTTAAQRSSAWALDGTPVWLDAAGTPQQASGFRSLGLPSDVALCVVFQTGTAVTQLSWLDPIGKLAFSNQLSSTTCNLLPSHLYRLHLSDQHANLWKLAISCRACL